MEKLLSLLSVLTISGTAVPTTIAASPYQKEETSTIVKNEENNNQQMNLENLNSLERGCNEYGYPDSGLKNINKAMILGYISKNKISKPHYMFPCYAYDNVDDLVKEIENKFINNKKGFSDIINFEEINKTELQDWVDIIENKTNTQQTIPTKSYSKTITNSYRWIIKLGFKGSIKFSFILGEGSSELSFEGSYENSKTISETETIPSKNIIVKPHTKVKLKTILEQTNYKNKGIIKIEIPVNEIIFIGNLNNTETSKAYMSIKDSFDSVIKKAVDEEKEHIYWYVRSDYFKETLNEKGNIVNFDDTNNIQKAWLNISIEWYSQHPTTRIIILEEETI